MRANPFLIILFIGLLFGACKKDDNRICTQADFIGIFFGSTVCSNGVVEDGTISVSAGSTETALNFDVSGSLFNVEIDGCNFTGSQKDSNLDLVYSGNLSGDKLEVTIEGLVFGLPFDCTTIGERQ